MTALSIAYPTLESPARREEDKLSHCLYCGKRLPFLRKLSGNRFCLEEHRRTWHLKRLVRALEIH